MWNVEDYKSYVILYSYEDFKHKSISRRKLSICSTCVRKYIKQRNRVDDILSPMVYFNLKLVRVKLINAGKT